MRFKQRAVVGFFIALAVIALFEIIRRIP